RCHQSRQTKSPWRETKNEQIQSPKTRRSDQYALRANASNFIYLNSIAFNPPLLPHPSTGQQSHPRSQIFSGHCMAAAIGV
ncbi:MAG: hypothetical protein Q8O37_10520, partial [Sulfuricellaceae bacterium]|nr:hypothetical protein [Sulfuricellaceae bacterium]